MEFKNAIFAILSIFCVVLSACAVSATSDVSNHSGDFSLDDGQDTHDSMILPPDYAHNEVGQAAGGDVYDNGVPSHDDGTDPAADDNFDNGVPFHDDGTDPAETAIGNGTDNAAGENATGNSTNATATHTMPATGNPIVLLLGACALVGGYSVIRKK